MDDQSVKKSDQGLTTTQIVAICIFVLLVIVIVIVYFGMTGKQVEKPVVVVVPDEEFCPPGTFSPDFGYGPNCIKCPAGTYSSMAGRSVCNNCEVGEYSDTGATICET
jgi:hypothetical protein